jgi:hypothetical protein
MNEMPDASEQCLTLFASGAVIRHGTLEEHGRASVRALCVCPCRLRELEKWCCCALLRASRSMVNVVLLCVDTSPHSLRRALGRIMLLMSDAPVSDNWQARHTTLYCPIQQALLHDSLIICPTRQHPFSHLQQQHNPFLSLRPDRSATNFNDLVNVLVLAAALPLENRQLFPIPEARFQHQQNPPQKTVGSQVKGDAAL